MFRALIPAAAALSLAAFAVQSQPAAAPDVELGMNWHLSHDGEMAKLAYGVANSDILAVMMTCASGDRMAQVHGAARPAGARVFPARHGPAPIDPLSGELIQDVRIPVSDPALRDLARRGALTVRGDAGAFTLRADRRERAEVRRFMDYCESARV